MSRYRPERAGGGSDTAEAAALLALSDERDLWERACLARELDAYRAGYADGDRDGHERGARLLEDDWPDVVQPVMQARPTHAELEERRWGPRGREHFADLRPGDYPGREAKAA